MAATAFSALTTLIAFAQTPMDSDFGVRYGMENQGLLVHSIGYKPTRDKTAIKNHRGADLIYIASNPKLTLSVDADITLLAGALAALHPMTPIHKNYVLDFYPEIAHGFSSALGYFLYEDPDTTSPGGGINSTKFTLTWFAPVANTVQLAAAPTTP